MDLALYREVTRMLAPLRRKLMLVANRAIVALTDDSKGMQRTQVKVLAGEVADPEHMQPGGLTHVPTAGAEGVFLTVGGARDDGVVICVSDRRYRPTDLAAGETALYNDGATQCTITLKADGSIELDSPTRVTITAPEVNLGGDTGGPVASADLVDAEFSRLWTMLGTTWVPVAQDGGAALKTLAGTTSAAVQSVAVSKTNAE